MINYFFQVVVGMKVLMRELHASVTALEKEAKFNKVTRFDFCSATFRP